MEDKMKLVIQIKNNDPVDLLDFSRSMLALGDEYRAYASRTEPEAKDASLFVKEIRNGCIVAELVAMAPYALNLIEHSETVSGYANHIKNVIDIFLGKSKKSPEFIEKDTLNNVSEIINPVAQDNGAQLNFSAINAQNDVHMHFHISDKEAGAIQNRISKELARRKEPDTGIKENVVLYWVQARGDDSTRAGDRGKIESIYNGDVRVRMSPEHKQQMLTGLPFPFKKAFLVDVDVQTKEGKPILYFIKSLHEIMDIDT